MYKVTPASFLGGKRCPKCAIKTNADAQRKTTEEFKKEVYELVKDEYIVLSEYHSSRQHVSMLHVECGNIYNARPDNFLSGKRCPHCCSSKGEERVEKFLKENGFRYKKEFTFKDLKGDDNRKLRFDFAILNKRNNPKFLIEYDGEFHYKKTKMNNNLFKQMHYDNLKSLFSKRKKIKLIRIPYWDFDNIEQILNEKLA